SVLWRDPETPKNRLVGNGMISRSAAVHGRLKLVPRLRRLVIPEPIEERQGGTHIRPFGALAKKIGGAQRRELPGDGDIEELVEGCPLRLGQPLGFRLERCLQPQRIIRLRHPCLHERHAGPGRSTLTPSRSAPAKSRSLNVSSRSARPL